MSLPDPTHAYSLQKIVPAYAGPAIRVRRSSDNSDSDIGFSGTLLDTTALLSFVGSGDGFVTTIYDQKESRDYTQSTSGSQPKIVDSGSLIEFRGIVGIQGDGNDDFFTTANLASPILDQDSTVLNVFVMQAAETIVGLFSEQSTGNSEDRILVYSDRRVVGSTPRLSVYSPAGGGAVESFIDWGAQQPADRARQITTLHNGTSYTGRAEGVEIDSKTVSDTFGTTTRLELLRQNAGSVEFPGIWHETVIYDSALTASVLMDAENDQLSRYNIALLVATSSETALPIAPTTEAILDPIAETDTALSISAMTGVLLSLPPETDTAIAINIQRQISVQLSNEIDAALSISPLIFTPQLFAFPQQGVFNASALVQPGWRLRFYTAGTDTPRQVYANNTFTAPHASPIVIDRFGRLPSIYVENSFDYRIVLSNEFDVDRWEISSFVWPHQTRRLAIAGTATETDTARTITPARILAIGVAAETDAALTITPS